MWFVDKCEYVNSNGGPVKLKNGMICQKQGISHLTDNVSLLFQERSPTSCKWCWWLRQVNLCLLSKDLDDIVWLTEWGLNGTRILVDVSLIHGYVNFRLFHEYVNFRHFHEACLNRSLEEKYENRRKKVFSD